MLPAAGSNAPVGNQHTATCDGGAKKMRFGKLGFVWCSGSVCQDGRTQGFLEIARQCTAVRSAAAGRGPQGSAPCLK